MSDDGTPGPGSAGRPAHDRTARSRLVLRRIATHAPRVVLLLGALFGLADALAFGSASLAGIEQWVPFDTPDADRVMALVTALALAALALGLWRGKRIAWWLAIVTFVAGVPIQVLTLGHPVGGMAAILSVVVLTLDRNRYGVRSARTWSLRAWAFLAAGAAVTLVETALAVAGAWSTLSLPNDLGDVATGIADWMSFGDPAANSWFGTNPWVAALAILARACVLLALLAMLRPEGEDAPDDELRRHVRGIAAEYGRGALLPFQTADDKRWFCPAGREAAVAYGRDGRVAVVVGDAFGRPDDQWPVFAEFVDACRRRDWIPVVYQASEAHAERLRHAGFQLSPIGREAILELPDFSLAGSRRANLRHTVTRARRGGITVRWFPDGIAASDPALLSQLAAVDAAWRAHAGPDMRFTINGFDPEDLARRPLVVAFEPDGRPAAFATFQSTGCDGGWVLDLLRRIRGGTPGAMEWCLAEAAERFRDIGATRLSLGLAPLTGLDPAGERVEERALAAIARLVRPFYDVEGLAFFKDKFAPRWETRYAAVPGRVHLVGLVLALARLHLGSLRRAAATTVADATRSLRGRAPDVTPPEARR